MKLRIGRPALGNLPVVEQLRVVQQQTTTTTEQVVLLKGLNEEQGFPAPARHLSEVRRHRYRSVMTSHDGPPRLLVFVKVTFVTVTILSDNE